MNYVYFVDEKIILDNNIKKNTFETRRGIFYQGNDNIYTFFIRFSYIFFITDNFFKMKLFKDMIIYKNINYKIAIISFESSNYWEI